MIVTILASILLILCVIHVLFNYNKFARTIKKIPGPKDSFIIGNAPEVLGSPAKLFGLRRVYAKAFNGIYRFLIYPLAAVIIYNPQDIEVVTSTVKHMEKSIVYSFLKPWLKDGLLISRGSKWQHRRKILTPSFHFNILRQFSTILQENGHRLIQTLESTAGRPINIIPVTSEFTLNSICETAMGTQLNKEGAKVGKSYKQAIYDIGKIVTTRFCNFYLIADFTFNLTPLGKLQKKLLKIIHEFTIKVIKERKEVMESRKLSDETLRDDDDDANIRKKRKRFAMLDLLLTAEKDGLIDKEGIQEEVDTFMFEGHDTTASGLIHSLLLFANNKHIQKKAAEEISNILGDAERPVNMDDVANMRYLECCIKESMRIYPPVHFFSRVLSESVMLSNYYVPKGVMCHISIFDLHHREDLFPNPSVFDPDRFLPENCVGRHPYAYIPFSAGPRNCIGQKFAMLEMKLILAEILRKFELQPVTLCEDVEFVADLVLRSSGPIYVTFVKKNNTS